VFETLLEILVIAAFWALGAFVAAAVCLMWPPRAGVWRWCLFWSALGAQIGYLLSTSVWAIHGRGWRILGERDAIIGVSLFFREHRFLGSAGLALVFALAFRLLQRDGKTLQKQIR
jgi:hypothetical protein